MPVAECDEHGTDGFVILRLAEPFDDGVQCVWIDAAEEGEVVGLFRDAVGKVKQGDLG